MGFLVYMRVLAMEGETKMNEMGECREDRRESGSKPEVLPEYVPGENGGKY
ncbi:MAG: hypothetical protein MUO76_05115 [Anaerolineaceae bacterium]|nr:hypothetical protein [Anaerolineaceae bacterium]